jgi:hypothetical protein
VEVVLRFLNAIVERFAAPEDNKEEPS